VLVRSRFSVLEIRSTPAEMTLLRESSTRWIKDTPVSVPLAHKRSRARLTVPHVRRRAQSRASLPPALEVETFVSLLKRTQRTSTDSLLIQKDGGNRPLSNVVPLFPVKLAHFSTFLDFSPVPQISFFFLVLIPSSFIARFFPYWKSVLPRFFSAEVG